MRERNNPKQARRQEESQKTSWNKVDAWYSSIVGTGGHFYHQEVIFPKLLPLLELKPNSKLLDIACGQGVLARILPKDVGYTGMDIAPKLISEAQKLSRQKDHRFICHDASIPWPLESQAQFSHATCILALQNIEHPEAVFKELSSRMLPGGLFAVVLNHPCFRIPRQSRWNFDEKTKTQTRELFSYMSPQSIPITTHPGKEQSETTWSFHFPLSTLSKIARENQFSMLLLDEWISTKTSTGGAAKWENRAREEFPLFLCALFQKL